MSKWWNKEDSKYAACCTCGIALSLVPVFLIPNVLRRWYPFYAGSALCLIPLMYVVVACLSAKGSLKMGAAIKASCCSFVGILVATLLAMSNITICATVNALLLIYNLPHGISLASCCILIVVFGVILNCLRANEAISGGIIMGLIVLGEASLRPWTEPNSSVAHLFANPGLSVTGEPLGYLELLMLWVFTMLGALVSTLLYTTFGIFCALSTIVLFGEYATIPSRQMIAKEIARSGTMVSLIASRFYRPHITQYDSSISIIRTKRDYEENDKRERPHEQSDLVRSESLYAQEEDDDEEQSIYRKSLSPFSLSAVEALENRTDLIYTLLDHAQYECIAVPHQLPYPEATRLLKNVFALQRRILKLGSVLTSPERMYGRHVLQRWWGENVDQWMILYARMSAAARIMAEELVKDHVKLGDVRSENDLIDVVVENESLDAEDEVYLSREGSIGSPRPSMSIVSQLLQVETLHSELRKGILKNFRLNWQRVLHEEATPYQELRSLMFVTTYSKRIVVSLRDVYTSLEAVKAKEVEAEGLWTRTRNFTNLLKTKFVVGAFDEYVNGVISLAQSESFSSFLHRPFVQQNIKLGIAIFFSLLPFLIISTFVHVVDEASSWVDQWQLFWTYVTTVIVFNRTLDATISKILIRATATFLSVLIGYIIMLNCTIAQSGLLLFVWMLFATFASLYFSKGPYSYAFVLFLLTQLIMIACQFSPDECLSSWQYAVARCITVIFGGIIGAFVVAVFFPSIAANEIKRTLSNTINKAAQSFEVLTELYISAESDANSYPALNIEEGGVNINNLAYTFNFLDSDSSADDEIHKRQHELVLSTLKEMDREIDQCRVTLRLESVPWQKGPLHIPAALRQLVTLFRELQRSIRLTWIIVNRAPVLTGYHAGTINQLVLQQGGSADLQNIAEKVSVLCQILSAELLSSSTFNQGFSLSRQSTKAIEEALIDLKNARVKGLKGLVEHRLRMVGGWVAYLKTLRSSPPISPRGATSVSLEEIEEEGEDNIPLDESLDPPGLNADDVFRFYAYIYVEAITLDLLTDITEKIITLVGGNRAIKEFKETERGDTEEQKQFSV